MHFAFSFSTSGRTKSLSRITNPFSSMSAWKSRYSTDNLVRNRTTSNHWSWRSTTRGVAKSRYSLLGSKAMKVNCSRLARLLEPYGFEPRQPAKSHWERGQRVDSGTLDSQANGYTASCRVIREERRSPLSYSARQNECGWLDFHQDLFGC